MTVTSKGNRCEICGKPSELTVEFKTHFDELIPMKMCTQCFFRLMGVKE